MLCQMVHIDCWNLLNMMTSMVYKLLLNYLKERTDIRKRDLF